MATRAAGAAAAPAVHSDDDDSDTDDGRAGSGADVAIVRKAVPAAVLASGGSASLAAAGKAIEALTVDYTPITADRPSEATLQLRATRMGRKTRMLVIITAYTEAGDELQRTLAGVAANLPSLQSAGLHWSEIQVLLVLDGRAKDRKSVV